MSSDDSKLNHVRDTGSEPKPWGDLTHSERVAWLDANPDVEFYDAGHTRIRIRGLGAIDPMPDAKPHASIPDGPQAPPPELPEVASLRKMFDSAAVVISATAQTVERMNSIAVMGNRFDDEARRLHTQARWLISLLGKAYGMEYMPPNLPPARGVTRTPIISKEPML